MPMQSFIVLYALGASAKSRRDAHFKALFTLMMVSLLVILSGCGTTMATAPNKNGEAVMLLGYDPVAYFSAGVPVRGSKAWKVALPDRTYYFSSADNQAAFSRNPQQFEPQYGGFCASGAAFGIKLGSDPTAFFIRDGRLFIFGDVLGRSTWDIDPVWNIGHADRLWPAMASAGWRFQSLMAYANKVPHYLNTAQVKAQWEAQNPGKNWPSYDPGGMLPNLFFKTPGWRAAEGFGQPALGYPE